MLNEMMDWKGGVQVILVRNNKRFHMKVTVHSLSHKLDFDESVWYNFRLVETGVEDKILM
jgi:hypothetical protein